MKVCNKCKQVKTYESFSMNAKAKDGLASWCKSCNQKAAILSNREKKTGCSPEMYDDLYEKQNGCCAICGKHNDTLKRSLAADHCHSTKNVRGLLCSSCNMGLGYFKDNKQLLKLAIKYLAETETGEM